MTQAITAGSAVRIKHGKLRGYRGEVVSVEGRHAKVNTAGGTVTLLLAELEAL